MKKLYFLMVALLVTGLSYGQFVINEIDADTPGTDVAEFIELKGTPSASLDGYVVVLFNGSNNLSYAEYDLTGYSFDANGFFILASTPLVTAGDYDIGASNILQNGADAVALYQAPITDFPPSSPVTSTNLIDALVYGTSDADDTDLLTGLGETIQYDENVNTASSTESIQRKADGTYETKAPTFRLSNSAAVCELSLTSNYSLCDAFTAGTDTYTASVNFTGGGTETYVVSADSGTVGGDNPSSVASGTITVSGVAEGTNVEVTAVGGLCNLTSTVTSPVCLPGLTLPLYESFSYADGSLINAPNWNNFSGTSGDLLVASGQALVQHGAPSEDASIAFNSVSGDVYYAFDLSVNNPGSVIAGGDYEYFAMFKDDATLFRAKLDIVQATNGGDFTVGIATLNSTADAVWTTDLTYGTTYRVTVRFNQDTNVSQLWLDAASSSDTSIMGADETDPGLSITQFALRQSDSSNNEGILVDNLVLSQTFAETLSVQSQNEIKGFSVYPNPLSNGFLNISTQNNLEKNIQIYDLLGKQVFAQTTNATTIDVSKLEAGIYVVRVEEAGLLATRKLVIE